MDLRNEQFLALLRASVTGSKPELTEELTDEALEELFTLAQHHQVLPLIYESVCAVPTLKARQSMLMMVTQQNVFRQVTIQTMKTVEYLQLHQHLHQAGLRPLTVKGIVCRNLYPNPDLRPSGDEDLLILPEQYAEYHAALSDFGMERVESEENSDTSYEIPYLKSNSPLYIEVHKHLFPPESEAYGNLNRFFEGVHDRAIQEVFDGTLVCTLEYSDHFFYLICHSFKHFLHGGFGIRQVCDIVLFANKYGSRMDWAAILDRCREIRAEKFTAALLRIGEKHLGFDLVAACYPSCWREIDVDEAAMLDDLMASGIYGGATMSRKHSSTMTLDAMTASNKGKQARISIWGSLFPSRKFMTGSYPYLEKMPWLLPMAWGQRIVNYISESRRSGKDSSAAEAMRIGRERIALMRQYGIIE